MLGHNLKKEASLKNIYVFPDGPIGRDGEFYSMSRGEFYYIDSIAKHFEKIIFVTYALDSTSKFYKELSGFRLDPDKFIVYELRSESSKKLMKKMINHLLNLLKIARIIRSAQCLFLFLPSYPSFMASVYSRFLRIPYFIYAADDWVNASESIIKRGVNANAELLTIFNWINKRMELFTISKAKFAVVAGGQLKEKYNKINIPTQLTVPRVYIPRSMWTSEKKPWLTRGKTFNLITVGALIEDKSQETLLYAVNELKIKYGVPISLKIVGNGPKYDELCHIARKILIIDEISFMGFVSSQVEVLRLIRESDAFVLTSVTEGFPRVIYESLSQSTPVVTTCAGGIALDMKHNVNCLMSDIGDSSGIARSLARLYNEKGLAEKLIMNGHIFLNSRLGGDPGLQIKNLYTKYIQNVN